MAIREIIVLPDKQLRLVSKPVAKGTADIRKLADDMFETMYDAPRTRPPRAHVPRTRDRARRDPDRAAVAADHHGSGQARGERRDHAKTARLHQSGDHLA